MLRKLMGILLLTALPLGAAPDKETLARTIEAHVRAYEGWDVFSGVVLLAKGDEVLFTKAYGLANQEFGVPSRLDTRFRLASINKFFTALVLAKLVHEKKLALDDPIQKWLPDFPRADKITVAHLANHRSGIRDPRPLRQVISRSLTPLDAVAVIAAEPFDSQPGEKYSYTTANYTLLAAILEKVTGLSYNEAMRQRLYAPAGLTDTGDVTTTTVIPRLANGYMPNPFGEGVAVSGPEDSSWKAGGGSSYSTASDLHRLLRFVYTRKLLPDIDPKNLWNVRKIGGRDAIAASGGMPGTSAYIAYLLEDEMTVVVLSNNYAGVTGRLGQDLLGLYYGEPIESPPPFTRAAAEIDEALLGAYEVPATGWSFDVTVRSGRPLISYRNSIRQTRLVRRGKDEYFIPMDWSVWRLKRNEAGAITGGTMTFIGDSANPLEFRRMTQ
jgi:CubicO group peptidase (beta-lactamase class C family)